MANYSVRLHLRDGTYIGEPPFFDMQGEIRMNEPDAVRFSISGRDLSNYVTDVKLLKAGLTEVTVVRNNVAIFTGPIWGIDTTSNEQILKITARDISSYLAQRYIWADTKFTKTKYGDAAWKLIQATQALAYGDLGITLGQGTPTATTTGSFSYTKKSGVNILESVTKLGEGTTGFDWEITPDRKMMMYYPRIQIPGNVILNYPGNVSKYSVQDVGTLIANDVMLKGSGSVVSSSYADIASKEKYGLRQYVGSDTSTSSATKLNSLAQTQLNLRKDSRVIPQLTVKSEYINPFNGDIAYGHLVYTRIDDGWVQFDGIMRCSGFQFTVSKHGSETFVLYINDTREIE